MSTETDEYHARTLNSYHVTGNKVALDKHKQYLKSKNVPVRTGLRNGYTSFMVGFIEIWTERLDERINLNDPIKKPHYS